MFGLLSPVVSLHSSTAWEMNPLWSLASPTLRSNAVGVTGTIYVDQSMGRAGTPVDSIPNHT